MVYLGLVGFHVAVDTGVRILLKGLLPHTLRESLTCRLTALGAFLDRRSLGRCPFACLVVLGGVVLMVVTPGKIAESTDDEDSDADAGDPGAPEYSGADLGS